MHQSYLSLLFAGGLFVGTIALLEVGRRLGRKHLSRDEEKARAGMAAVEGAVFGLMGLLIAFTFSGAAARFDDRRQLIIDEANAIGTAWLRLDLLPPTVQPGLRDVFRRYVDARLAVYRQLPNMAAVKVELDKVGALQGEIWRRAVAAGPETPAPGTALLLPALNEMFDLASTRVAKTRMHPPLIIFCMLGVLALMSALLAGYAMAGSRWRSWIHVLGFGLILGLTVYLILDLEFPRFGLLRVDDFDGLIADVRAQMN